MKEKEQNIETVVVHGGEEKKWAGALTHPIVQTSTYIFENSTQLRDYTQKKTRRWEYGRYGNPTVETAEKKLARLENAEHALLFSSGMTALTTCLFAIVESGSHILFTNDSYRRTRQFLLEVFSKFGVEYSIVEPNLNEIKKAIRENTKVFISECPTNPYLRVLDLARLNDLAKKHNWILLVDATLSTPYNLQTLDLGVDLVVHSATKYLAGHNDIMAGVVMSRSDLLSRQIQNYRDILGGVLDPQSAYLLIRGIKTLALRMEHQNRSALAIAQFLEAQPKVLRVHYSGLPSHPDYEVAKKQLKGFGGVLSFEVKSDDLGTARFIDALKIPYIAPSMGGVESLVEQVYLMSYYEMDPKERRAIGIHDNLIRYSVGIENTQDLILDLKQALKSI